MIRLRADGSVSTILFYDLHPSGTVPMYSYKLLIAKHPELNIMLIHEESSASCCLECFQLARLIGTSVGCIHITVRESSMQSAERERTTSRPDTPL